MLIGKLKCIFCSLFNIVIEYKSCTLFFKYSKRVCVYINIYQCYKFQLCCSIQCLCNTGYNCMCDDRTVKKTAIHNAW